MRLNTQQLAALETALGLAEEAIEAREASEDEEDHVLLPAYQRELQRAWDTLNLLREES